MCDRFPGHECLGGTIVGWDAAGVVVEVGLRLLISKLVTRCITPVLSPR